jgi:hypothetical protein
MPAGEVMNLDMKKCYDFSYPELFNCQYEKLEVLYWEVKNIRIFDAGK